MPTVVTATPKSMIQPQPLPLIGRFTRDGIFNDLWRFSPVLVQVTQDDVDLGRLDCSAIVTAGVTHGGTVTAAADLAIPLDHLTLIGVGEWYWYLNYAVHRCTSPTSSRMPHATEIYIFCCFRGLVSVGVLLYGIRVSLLDLVALSDTNGNYETIAGVCPSIVKHTL